ncbi:MAG TPA: ASCH domain-containing protein [Tepidisphaeraceae bacterium]|jgi:hypothetical protein|nr:ASCH domain-containing protein [Tepidisphaeraceae bacterium]
MGLLLFKREFLAAIRSGSKRTTIRRWDRPRVRAGGSAFAPGLGWLAIESVDTVELKNLSDGDALADGFRSAAEMRKTLRRLYPSSRKDNRSWFRVRFRLP